MSLMQKPLSEIVQGLREQRWTPSDLLRDANEALARTEPRLNAYKLRTNELAEAAAREADARFRSGSAEGLFTGLPVSVKDLYGIPGVATFAGSARELPEKWRTPGPLVRCLLEQRAAIVGKTHTVEFAFGALGLNNHWGTPWNPWDANQQRAPGGSSSGAGVSLCQGSALVALGSDTAGSVRVPASLTGNVGYKPTIGRWSTAGIVPLSPYLDTPGILARTVEDAMLAAAELDRALGVTRHPIGSAPPAATLRIGIPTDAFWNECDRGIAEGVHEALAELERAGHRLVAMACPEAAGAIDIFSAGSTPAAELLAFLRHELPEWIAQLDPNVGTRIEAAGHIPAADFLQRKMAIEALALRARDCFADVDVIACPTVAQTPPVVPAIKTYEQYRPLNFRTARNTSVANLLQWNGLTLPVALDAAGMPVGLQIMAANGRDDLLFSAGLAMERVLGTARTRIGVPPAIAASPAARTPAPVSPG